MQYSVLMSVYIKEQPEFLKTSMESMFNQTIPPDDFVLVCDGPLTEELDKVIEEQQKLHGTILQVVRLKKNGGLGNALQEGMRHCRYELIARMDSDDISYLNRCERQLAEFSADPMLDIISGTIEEFVDKPEIITGKRILPETHEEICKFSRKRCPFNHPAVMYKKTSVLAAGGYSSEYRLEDYYLWVRMLMNGCYSKNIQEPLVYMRTPIDLYLRRGGWGYAKDMLRFHFWAYRFGWESWNDYLTGAILHSIICVIPNKMRKELYKIIRN